MYLFGFASRVRKAVNISFVGVDSNSRSFSAADFSVDVGLLVLHGVIVYRLFAMLVILKEIVLVQNNILYDFLSNFIAQLSFEQSLLTKIMYI